jgi:hypothetical protein
MSNDENTSKQAQSDASPEVEPDHVEGATADNPPATAGPNHSLLDEKSKHRLRVEQLKLEFMRSILAADSFTCRPVLPSPSRNGSFWIQ